ncbi:anti-CBASS protein Acb1 family protein, partial [Campylobacter jejuni]|uniref:anti-CBASS protein Acb1 family protein n=1 Tax=Campylobacter jejuni TaxID=197 RepID=UPI002242B408
SDLTWASRFKDEWFNEIGNVNAGNSLTQYSSFLINRMPYNECAFLASDSIINNAITKYCNEILRKGGKIIVDIEDKEYQSDLVEKLEKRLQNLKFFETLKEAIATSLTYGGALIFIDVNSEDLSEPLYL